MVATAAGSPIKSGGNLLEFRRNVLIMVLSSVFRDAKFVSNVY